MTLEQAAAFLRVQQGASCVRPGRGHQVQRAVPGRWTAVLLVAGLGSRVIRVQPSPSLKHSATAVRLDCCMLLTA